MFWVFESDTVVSRTRARRCAQKPIHAEEGAAAQTRTAKKKRLELDTPTRRYHLRKKGPILSPKPSPGSTPSLPQRQAGSGQEESGLGHAQTLATTIWVGGATSTERGPLLTEPWGFTVRHSLEDLPAQLRRVPWTVEAQLSVNPHAVSPTFDADHDAILCPLGTLIALRRGPKALFCTSSPVLRNVLGARRARAGSRRLRGQTCSSAGRGGWQPRRQRDEERILRLPRCARCGQPDTQLLLAADLQALSALNGTSPASSHNLVRGPTVHAYEGLLHMCKVAVATRLCTVLA